MSKMMLVWIFALLIPSLRSVDAFSAIAPPLSHNKVLVLVEPSPLTYGTYLKSRAQGNPD